MLGYFGPWEILLILVVLSVVRGIPALIGLVIWLVVRSNKKDSGRGQRGIGSE